MAMKHDGHATYDEVPNLSPVEGTEYLRECAARHVPIVSWRQLRAGFSAPPPGLAASRRRSAFLESLRRNQYLHRHPEIHRTTLCVSGPRN
jgi:hypothetical protein